MTELVMTAIFFYSIYKIVDSYPVISVALIVCYLSSLAAFVYI